MGHPNSFQALSTDHAAGELGDAEAMAAGIEQVAVGGESRMLMAKRTAGERCDKLGVPFQRK